MSILAVAIILASTNNVTDPTKLDLTISVTGIKAGSPFSTSFVEQAVDPTVAPITFTANVEAGIKSWTIANEAYTYGLLDTVALIGGNLL